MKGNPVAYDDKKWQAEDDLRTLQRAQEVRDDPKRLKAALALIKKQQITNAETIARETRGLRAR